MSVIKESLVKHVHDYLANNFNSDEEEYEEGWEQDCAEEIVNDELVAAIERKMVQQFKVDIFLNNTRMNYYRLNNICALPYDGGRPEMEKMNFFLSEPAVKIGDRLRTYGQEYSDMCYVICECCYLTQSGKLVFTDEMSWSWDNGDCSTEIVVEKKIVKKDRCISFEIFKQYIPEGIYEEFFWY